MTAELEQLSITNTIRRMIRVLGAMPASIDHPESVHRAARFVHDRMARSGKPVTWFEPEDASPLVLAGDGPVLLVSYIDDADPYSSSHSGQPPSFRDTFVSGPGILRKAGVVAAAAAELDNPDRSRFTVAIETDRNSGSRTLETWLNGQAHRFTAALWEATDLPILAPAIIHSASGRLTMRVRANVNHHFAESQFGGVVPDIGRLLSEALGNLVSEDYEVRLDGFYDEVEDTDEAAMRIYQEMTDRTEAWLHRIAPGDIDMPSSHLTMGVFVAPAVVVRSFNMIDRHPYLPVACEAVVDFHLVPGQLATEVGRNAITYFTDRVPGAEVEILLLRPPVSGKANIAALREAFPRVLKTVPSVNPAGIIESFGIPTVGYASIGRNPENTSGRVALEDAVNGARLIQELARRMSGVG